VTLDEFIEIEARMHSTPIEVKSHVLEDNRADRLNKGVQNLPSSEKPLILYLSTSAGRNPNAVIFETQLAFVVECADLFVTEVIHRKGRIQQSMNARRQKVENQIRKEEFAERLYVAIEFLGGNFIYRDSERFWNIRYFIHRYLTEKCLRLELKFIHRCMEKLTGMVKQFDQTFLNLNFELF
jgi:hypothetical protein